MSYISGSNNSVFTNSSYAFGVIPSPHFANTLGMNNVNVDYAYAFVTAKAGRAMLILRVDDIKRAAHMLSEAGVRIATKEEIQEI